MSRKMFGFSLAILSVVIGALAYLNIREDARENVWIESFPMTNQSITWEGAGYSGIYGRNQE